MKAQYNALKETTVSRARQRLRRPGTGFQQGFDNRSELHEFAVIRWLREVTRDGKTFGGNAIGGGGRGGNDENFRALAAAVGAKALKQLMTAGFRKVQVEENQVGARRGVCVDLIE